MKYGGDIIKFVGDAMIIVWPPPIAKSPEFSRLSQDEEDQDQGTILERGRKAAQCAIEI